MSENNSEVRPNLETTIQLPEHPATKLINSGKVSAYLITAHEQFDKEPTVTNEQFASYKNSNVEKLPLDKKSPR